MNMRKVVIGLAIALAVLSIFFLYQRFTSNDLELRLQSSRPVGVRLALLDQDSEGNQNLELLAQMILYPDRDRVLFYFVNTDAYYEDEDDPIRTMSPGSADNFAGYTDVSSDYYIHMTRTEAIRMLNLMEGLAIFVDEPMVFDHQQFIYPNGLRFMPGEQILEFVLARKTSQPDRAYLNGTERLGRMESMVLNLFWRRAELAGHLSHDAMAEFAADGANFDSNMTAVERRSLFAFITDHEKMHASVLEAPLREDRETGQPRLIVKDDRSRVIYTEYEENLQLETLTPDDFPVDVLNGTDISGQARRLKGFLQDRGLLVLDADNYRFKPLAHSVIIERSGDTWRAQRLMELTGLERKRVVFRRMGLDVDATFVIGNDFDLKKLSNR